MLKNTDVTNAKSSPNTETNGIPTITDLTLHQHSVEMILNKILVGDTPDLLKEVKRFKIKFDVIIADPPYNIGKDFGNNKDCMPLEDYVQWTLNWIEDCLELLDENALLYLYGFPEIIARISAQFPLDKQRWLVWHYTNKTIPSSNFWQRSHETILCLWKLSNQRPGLEIDQIREPYTSNYIRCAGRERKNTPSRFGSNGVSTTYNAHENGALPRDVIKVPALAGGAGRTERWFMCRSCDRTLYRPEELNNHRNHDILKHPTQKPKELTKRLIKSRINGSGGKVLIPFAGSGSECVVAQELKLKFLGLEINPEYAEFARKWLTHSNEVK